MARYVTIKDVARAAGVGHTTVSRVIRNQPFIRDETKSRVLAALERLDYRPNMVARGLIRKRSHVIALITPELEPFSLPVIRGVTKTSANWDYALMLIPMDTWMEEDRSISFVAENWLVDGMLVYNIIHHDTVPAKVRQLQRGGTPMVFINKFLDKQKLNVVGVDNVQGVRVVMEHLNRLGHRRIGMLGGALASADGQERKGAWYDIMKELGRDIDESIVGNGDFKFDKAYEETRRILKARKRPTALYCANDLMAIGALRAAQEAGLRVPEDLAIAGFDDLEAGRHIDVPITTARPPLELVGAKAFEMMMDLLRNPGQPPQQVRLPTELLVRASTVRPHPRDTSTD